MTVKKPFEMAFLSWIALSQWPNLLTKIKNYKALRMDAKRLEMSIKSDNQG